MVANYPNRRQIGNEAEHAAVALLRKRGLDILARNIRFHGTEIDILASKTTNGESTYYFIEVKRIRREHYDAGYPYFSAAQLRRYRQAIRRWHSGLDKVVDTQIGVILLDRDLSLIEFLAPFTSIY